MVTAYKDPVWGKVYKKEDNLFYNEETGYSIKEDFAIANGFKPLESSCNLPKVPPLPEIVFDKKGNLYKWLCGTGTKSAIYRNEETIKHTTDIWYEDAMREGFTTEFTVCPPPPTSMEMLEALDKSKKAEAEERLINDLVNAVSDLVEGRAYADRGQGYAHLNKAKSELRKAIVNILK